MWQAPDYDDSGWSNGLAIFEGNRYSFPTLQEPIRTTLNLTNAAGTAQVITYYFRRRFNLPIEPWGTTLELHQMVDDGAVYYLNGTEVFNSRMPTNRPLSATNLALFSIGTAAYEPPVTQSGYSLTNSALRAGDNVLAVEVHQYTVNSSDVTFGAVLEGILSFDARISITVPTNATEGDGILSGQGLIRLSQASQENLIVSLMSDNPAKVQVPSTLTIPAGETNAVFDLTILDDPFLDAPQNIIITATASGFKSASRAITIFDNDTTTLSVVLPPYVSEGTSVTGMVLSANTPTADFLVNLSTSDTNVVRVPSSVIFASGQTSAVFTISVGDDFILNGSRYYDVIAQRSNWTSGSTRIEVTDNESTNLDLRIPAYATEGDGVLTNAGRIYLGGITTTNLTIWLSSSDPTKLLVPESIIISAGRFSAYFDLSIVDNTLTDGTRPATIVCSASGFLSASNIVNIADNDVHHFGFSSVSSLQYTGQAFVVTIKAWDVNGVHITNYNGGSSLSATSIDGPVTCQPSSIGPFTNGVWSGAIQMLGTGRLVKLMTSPVMGESNPFHVEAPPYRTLWQPSCDLAYHPQSGALFALVPSGGGLLSNSLAVIDPTLPAVTNSYFIGNDPFQMELAANGAFLYASINGRTVLQRFSLANRTLGTLIDLGGLIFPDFTLINGESDSVVAPTLDHSGNWKGLSLFRAGVQSYINVGNRMPYAVESSTTQRVIYGFEPLNLFPLLRISAVDGSVTSTNWIVGWFNTTIKEKYGVLYTGTGRAISGDRFEILGEYTGAGGLVEVDPAQRRVFWLFQSYMGGPYQIQVFDRDSFTLLSSVTLPSLRRWGLSTSAFRNQWPGVQYVRGANLVHSNGYTLPYQHGCRSAAYADI